jgi:hypothetical protein
MSPVSKQAKARSRCAQVPSLAGLDDLGQRHDPPVPIVFGRNPKVFEEARVPAV